MSSEDRCAVAADVQDALLTLDIGELNGRAGPQPGRGYVHPVEAADEILDEALQPFLARRAALGMRSAATELAVGILAGLYACRDGRGETVLQETPDYPAERASEVLRQCHELGVDLPGAQLLELIPEWDTLQR